MKNVLFATTALVLTAGVASAEVTFSGKAEAGVVSVVTGSKAGLELDATGSKVAAAADTGMEVYSGIDIDIAVSGATDSGMSISTSVDMGAGFIADVADKEVDSQGATLGAPTIAITSGATTVSLANQGIDDLYDDSQNGDIGIATSFGDATVAITYDTDAAADNATMSYSLGYSMSGVSLSIVGTDADDSNNSAMVISASYSMGDMTLGLKSDNKGAADTINTLSVSYVAGPATVSVSVDDNDDWDASIAYSAGAASFNFSTDESDAWEADVSYDLGGATAFAATDSTDTMIAGVNFAF
jgi:outer membrane protein OmpU